MQKDFETKYNDDSNRNAEHKGSKSLIPDDAKERVDSKAGHHEMAELGKQVDSFPTENEQAQKPVTKKENGTHNH
jgi:hypothetical protein